MNKSLQIVILGLENAGKSTLLRTVTNKPFKITQPTIGIDIEMVDYNGYRFQAIDMGGQKVFRDTLWPHYATLGQGVIFVFDIFDEEKVKEARTWFNLVVEWISEKAVLIFLANKIDLKTKKRKYLSTEKIIKSFGIDKISQYPGRSFRIFEISAKTGENVKESMTWLFDKLTEHIKEETKISFVYLFDSQGIILYSNMDKNERSNRIANLLLERISQMRELNTNSNYLTVGEYKMALRVEEQYSIVIGTKFDVSQNNILRAIKSLTTAINDKYLPLSDNIQNLDGIVNVTLMSSMRRNR